jgi:hypothetical protein
MPRGGFREGSGRPREDVAGEPRRKHSIYCTESELEMVRSMLKETRNLRKFAKENPGKISKMLSEKQ